jgi:hypothetical protein
MFPRSVFGRSSGSEPHTDDTGIASVEAAYSRTKRFVSCGFLCAAEDEKGN